MRVEGQDEDLEDRRGQGGELGGVGRGASAWHWGVGGPSRLESADGSRFLVHLVQTQVAGSTGSQPARPPTATSPEEAQLSSSCPSCWTTTRPCGNRFSADATTGETRAVPGCGCSACGLAQSATGPFYCPGRPEGLHRHRVLSRVSRFGAPGEFAQATCSLTESATTCRPDGDRGWDAGSAARQSEPRE